MADRWWGERAWGDPEWGEFGAPTGVFFESMRTEVEVLVHVVFQHRTKPRTTFDYYASGAGATIDGVHYHADIESLSPLLLSRISGTRILGSSSPGSGDISLIPSPRLMAAIDRASWTCERRAVTISRARRTGACTWEVIDTHQMHADGHEIDAERIQIRVMGSGFLFQAQFQQAMFLGLGRSAYFPTEDGPQILITNPADGSWDPDTGLTIEVCLRVDSFALISGSLLSLGGTGLLKIQSTGALSFVQTTPNETHIADTHIGLNELVHLVFTTDGTETIWYQNAAEDGVGASASLSSVVDVDCTIGQYLGVNTGFFGEINFARCWNLVRTPQQILDTLFVKEIPDDDKSGLFLNLPMSEGLGDRVYDPDNGYVGEMTTESGEGTSAPFWRSSLTGDPELRGKRKPTSWGHVLHRPAVLIDRLEQIYMVHHRSCQETIPSVGGQPMAAAASLSINLSFHAAEHLIVNESTTDFEPFQAFQQVEVVGSTLNDDVHLVGDVIFWSDPAGGFAAKPALRVASLLEDEASVACTISTRTGFATELEITGTLQFFSGIRRFRAEDGQSFEGLAQGDVVTVANTTKNNHDFVLSHDAYQRPSDGKWVCRTIEASISETTGSSATVTRRTDLGEYEIGNSRHPGNGVDGEEIFTLFFLPNFPVGAEVWGDDVGGYVDTAPAIIQRQASVMGSAETQAVAVVAATFDDLAAEEPWEYQAITGTEDIEIGQVWDGIAQGAGCHWYISPRDSKLRITKIFPASAPTTLSYHWLRNLYKLQVLRARRADRRVEVLWGRNFLVLTLDQISLLVTGSQSRSGAERTQFVQREYDVKPSASEHDDEKLTLLPVESGLTTEADALALANRLFGVFGVDQMYFEALTGLEIQEYDPWQVLAELTDTRFQELAGGRAGWVLSSAEDAHESRLVVVITVDP